MIIGDTVYIKLLKQNGTIEKERTRTCKQYLVRYQAAGGNKYIWQNECNLEEI